MAGTSRKHYLMEFYGKLYRLSHSVQIRFSKAGHLLLLFILLTAVFGIDTRQTQIYQMFALGMAIFVSAYLFSRLNGKALALSFSRNLPYYASVGDRFNYHILIDNHSDKTQYGLVLYEIIHHRFPTYEEFNKANPPGEKSRNWFDRRMGYPKWIWLVQRVRGFEVVEHSLPPLTPGSNKIELSCLPLKRGRLSFQSVKIGCPDPLGIFRRFLEFTCKGSVLVLPKIYSAPSFRLSGPRMYQAGGMVASGSVGDSEEFFALRDYQAGDPKRFIHWRSWAKRGEPVVKKFQEQYFQRHALVLDTYCDSEVYIPYNEAVNLAASLTYEQYSQDSLLDLMFIGEQAYCFTAGRGQNSAQGLLEILAGVRVQPRGDFRHLISLVRSNLSRMSAVLCVFCHWDDNRRDLFDCIISNGINARAFVVSYQDPGIMQDYTHVDKVTWLAPHDIRRQLERLAGSYAE